MEYIFRVKKGEESIYTKNLNEENIPYCTIFKSDNYFIIRAKNILQSQKQQTSRGFLFSLKENFE